MIQALWSLDQQFQNKNGSILTHGKIYVYYKGRTALATTYNDEDGTVVNPNPILLDNNGRAACFASSSYAYTILVCDAYGKELFSYDLTLHDAVATADKVFVIGSDGSVKVDPSTLPNGIQYDLSVNTDVIATKQSVDDVKDDLDDLSDTVDNHTTEIGQLQDDVDDIEDTLANKKDKQTAKSFDGAATKTVKKITQNADGEMNVEFEDIDLPPEVPNVDITSPNGTIDVQSSTDVQTNTKTFEIDVKNSDPVWHYWTGNNAWTQIATKSWTQINRPAIGTGSNPHPWNPDIKRGVYDTKAHFTVTFHNYNNSKTVPNQIIQVGFRAKFVGKNDPSAIRYEDLGAWTYDPTLYTTEAYQYNFAQESLRQNHDTSKIINVANYWGDTDFNVYFEAALLNTDGSQDTPPIDTVLMAEITYFGYHEVKGVVQSTSGGGKEYTKGDGITIDDTDDTISVDAGEGLTFDEGKLAVDFDEVNEHQVQSDWNQTTNTEPDFIKNKPVEKQLVEGRNIHITDTGTGIEISSDSDPQVQSDWTESDTTDPAYIQNKPTEKSLIAGQNVTITDTANGVRIDAAGGTFTQVQSNWTESDNTSPAYIQNKPDMSTYATDTELSNAVDTLEQQIQNIPAQEQSNWAESDSSDPSYIKNKPSTCSLVAGQNVTITDQGSSVVISATGGGTQVQSNWNESDTSSPAYIQNKPTEKNLVAGTNVTITETNDDVIVETTEIASGAQLVAGSGINIQESSGQVVVAADETVLWTGNGTPSSSVTLSENMNNFEFIDVYERWDNSSVNATVHRIYMEGKTTAIINFAIGMNSWYLVAQKLNLNGTTLSVDSVHSIHGSSYTSTDISHESNTTLLKNTIVKVVGINRIANN